MGDCVLVTGGAGYIGSHAVLALRDAGQEVIVIDDLSTGSRQAIPEGTPLIEGSAGDQALVGKVLRRYGIKSVIHFAGSIVVPESVVNPLKYYRNNTCVSRSLIEACVAGGVSAFIFSSTAAVYGMPAKVPINESAETAPINPYGTSKLMTEWILRDAAAAAEGFRYAALRYFNVAGADPQGRSGQRTRRPTHLIEVACHAALGQRDGLEIFGDDYDTPDGTCVRDYIHVTDLVEAHLLALNYLAASGRSGPLNLGNQRGFSVREVVNAVRRISGREFPVHIAPRRPGDPALLVADSRLAQSRLGWRPNRSDLETLIADAWRWHKAQIEHPVPSHSRKP